MVTYLDYFLSIKSNDHIISWCCEITWQTKNSISTTTMSMVTKLGRMVTYLEWLLPIKSRDHIITWFCKITWKTKIITYPLTQWLRLSILAGWAYTMRSSFHKVTGSFDQVVLQGHVNYFSYCITTSTRPVFTKLSKVVTSIRNFNPLSHATLHTTPLPQYLQLPNLAGW